MDKQEVKYAVLHDTIGVPTEGGKMINLKATLDPDSIEGLRWGLAMRTAGSCLEVDVNGTTALVPMTNFKVIVLKKK